MDTDQWKDFPLLSLQPHVMKQAMEAANCRDVIRLGLSAKESLCKVSHTKLDNLKEAWFYFGSHCEVTLIDEKTSGDTQKDVYWCFWQPEELNEEAIAQKIKEEEEMRLFREKRGMPQMGAKRDVSEDEYLWKEHAIVDGKVLSIRCMSDSFYGRYIPGPSSGNDETRLCTKSADPKESFRLAQNFLNQIFHPPKSCRVHVDVDMWPDFETTLLASKFLKNVTSMVVLSDEKEVTEEQFKFISSNFPMLKNLDLSKATVHPTFLEENETKIDTLRLNCYLRDLRKTDSVYLIMDTCSMYWYCFQEFIQKWQSGQSARLKSMKISTRKTLEMMLLADSVNALPVLEPVKYRTGDVESWSWCRKGEEKFDVKRESDGKRATVCWDTFCFFFYVRD